MQILNVSKYLFDQEITNRDIYYWHGDVLKSKKLIDQIYRCACYFLSKYQPRQTVILTMDDCPEWIIAFHAMILVGIIPVVVDYRSSDTIKNNIKNRTLAVDMISSSEDIVYYDGEVKIFNYRDHDDIAYYATSGTTGIQKIVVYQHKAFCELTTRMKYLHAKNGTILCPAKMSFVVGLIVNVLGPWIMHSQNVIYDSAPSALRTLFLVVNKYKVTHLFTNPTILKIFNQNKLAVLGKHLSYVFVSAEPLTESVAVNFEQKFGLRPINVYGATETLCSVLINLNHKNNITDLGHPVNDCKFKIINEHGQIQPNGTPGQLLVHSPCVASRYHNDQVRSANTFNNGWYCTGDIVVKIDDRFIFVDRVDNYIKIRGCYTSSLEVENLLMELPNILETTVTFDTYKDGTPKIIAYVVANGDNLNVASIRSDLMKITKENHLLPDQIHLVKELPKTLNNKKIKNFKLLKNIVNDATI